jgi:hypothetical protein
VPTDHRLESATKQRWKIPPEGARSSSTAAPASATTVAGLKTKYANIPVENFAAFTEGSKTIQGRIEPVNAQQVYAILDSVMQGVLTNRDADPQKLLDEAQKKVDAALATVK